MELTDPDNPYASYHVNMTSGDVISIDIPVNADTVDFDIYNSSEENLFQRSDIDLSPNEQ